MNDSIRKQIEEKIILNQITRSDDEKIGAVADSFPERYNSEEEYLSFQKEISEIVEEMEFTCELTISDEKKILDYYSADADYMEDFNKNGIDDRELSITLEVREGGERVVMSELNEPGSQAQWEDYQAVIDWLENNDEEIIWEKK